MVRIAVLGAGRIGKIHAANVAANPKATAYFGRTGQSFH